MNVGAVETLMSLAKKMNKLQALVHVSTAYANCNRSHIEEKVYPSPAPPQSALGLLSTLTPEVLDSPEVTGKILGDRPNTYTFTKAMAEELVVTEGSHLPVCIVRPSIVVSTWKEPIAGWVDNLNGPTGLFLIAGIGVMRTAVIHEDLLVDGVPVDACANLIIAAGWKTNVEFKLDISNNIQIYNQTSGNCAPLKWGEIYKMAEKHLFANPLEGMVWYPGGTFKRSITVNRLY